MNTGLARSRDGNVTPSTSALTPADIEARVRWARRQGYVGWFWPDIPVAAWRACLFEIERVTSLLLRREPPAGNVDLVVPSDATARALGIAAFTSGMGPMLGHWIERGRLTADGNVAALLADHLDHSRRRAERMRLVTHDALDRLAEIRIRPILVKAAHTSHSLFAEPGLRPAADIDIVVERDHFVAAEIALAKAGYTSVKQRRNPHKSDWLPPGVPHGLRSIDLTHAENPFTLELHGSLDREFYGVYTLRFSAIGHLAIVPAPELHASARILAQPLLAMYLAAHASEELHQLQLIRLVELALLLQRDAASGVLDWSELDSMLLSRAAHRFTFPAFELVERLLPGTVDPWFRGRLASLATPRMRAVVGRMSPATAQRLDGLSLDERFLWTDGLVETVRRFLHLFRPPRDGRSLARHWTDRVTRLMRGRVSLRRGEPSWVIRDPGDD
jgi:hypothetical protein